ncbi:MAG: hypothetical protein II352_01800 [Selenomonadaceae bacterium]|nr:hypothetical protein [Selenomonadaceae bacterium]
MEKSKGQLSVQELKSEMEDWTLYENSFVYQGNSYSLTHIPGDGRYCFGKCDGDEPLQYFPDFDSVANAPLIAGKSIVELIDELDWDSW